MVLLQMFVSIYIAIIKILIQYLILLCTVSFSLLEISR